MCLFTKRSVRPSFLAAPADVFRGGRSACKSIKLTQNVCVARSPQHSNQDAADADGQPLRAVTIMPDARVYTTLTTALHNQAAAIMTQGAGGPVQQHVPSPGSHCTRWHRGLRGRRRQGRSSGQSRARSNPARSAACATLREFDTLVCMYVALRFCIKSIHGAPRLQHRSILNAVY